MSYQIHGGGKGFANPVLLCFESEKLPKLRVNEQEFPSMFIAVFLLAYKPEFLYMLC